MDGNANFQWTKYHSLAWFFRESKIRELISFLAFGHTYTRLRDTRARLAGDASPLALGAILV